MPPLRRRCRRSRSTARRELPRHRSLRSVCARPVSVRLRRLSAAGSSPLGERVAVCCEHEPLAALGSEPSQCAHACTLVRARAARATRTSRQRPGGGSAPLANSTRARATAARSAVTVQRMWVASSRTGRAAAQAVPQSTMTRPWAARASRSSARTSAASGEADGMRGGGDHAQARVELDKRTLGRTPIGDVPGQAKQAERARLAG